MLPSATFELIEVVRMIRSAGGMLFEHALLTAELAQTEWEIEEMRLKKLLLTTLLYAILIGLVLFQISLLSVVLAWDTPYRSYVAGFMLLVWLVSAWLVRRRLRRIGAAGESRFAASRREVRKTMDLLRQHL